MPRRQVYTFGSTWLDSDFKKSLSACDGDTQSRVVGRLTALLRDLAEVGHPALDPRLKPWGPRRYPGVLERHKGVTPLEYGKGKDPLRVIAVYFEKDGGHEMADSVLMVAATLAHDHARMLRLIKGHEFEISRWAPGE